MPGINTKLFKIKGKTYIVPEYIDDFVVKDGITHYNKIKMSNFNIGISKVDETEDGYISLGEGIKPIRRNRPKRTRLRVNL